MAFLRKYTNVDGDGQVAGQSPDSRGDFYDPTDKQRDFDYWQAKVGDVLRAVSKTPSTEIQILQGGEITDAGSGNVDMVEGWAIVKNAAGVERIVNRPEFLGVGFPVAFNDGRDVWVASRFEQALDALTRVHKTETTSYKFIHIDSFTGDTAFGETTNDMFFDSDPGANYVIWDKITMTGTTFAKIVGRSQEWKPFNSSDKIEDALDVDDSGSKIVDDLLVWDGTKWKRQATGTKIFAKLKAETDTGDVKSLLNLAAGDARYVQGGGSDPGIINGNMEHWQENTLVTTAPSQSFFADLFQYLKTGPQVHTISRDADAPEVSDGAQAGANFSILTEVTAANTGLDITEDTTYDYRMEGLQFKNYFGQAFTITFFVKSSLVGIYTISFRNEATDRYFVHEYTVNAANTWEKKIVPITHNTANVWNLSKGIGMIINWTLAGGSNFQTSTPEVWANGNFITTAAAVNFDATVGNKFRLAQVSMNFGASARNNLKDDAQELNRIHRYFQNPIRAEHSGDVDSPSTLVGMRAYTKVVMRAIPTITITELAGMTNISGGSVVVSRVTEESFSVNATAQVGGNWNVNADAKVDARL